MATITITLGAGSVATPFYYEAKITKQLCNKTANTPVFTPTFSLVSYSLVSSTVAQGQYEAIVNVSGIVTYTPCGSCCAKSQVVNERVVIPFYSATEPSLVAISSGTPTNSLVTKGCSCGCSNTFTCDVPVSLTIETT